MADNVAITAGVGTSIAADDVGSVFYQRMKLVTSEDGSAEPIGDTDLGSSRALWVDNRPVVIDQQLTSAGLTIATTAYTSGDALGTIMELTNAARASGGSGVITGLSILDEGDVLAAVDLYISKASISQTDNAAFAPSDSDARNILHKIRFPALDDLGGNRFMSLDGLFIPYVCSTTSIFFTLVTLSANAIFTAVGDIKLNIFGTKF